MIPAGQVVTEFTTEFEDAHIWRRDRAKMMRIHADPREGLASELMARVKPAIEQALGVDLEQKYGRTVAPEDWDATTVPVVNNDRLPLKSLPGYSFAWGGEVEDSAGATASLAGSIPIFFGLMILIVIVLFNSIKKTLIIWLCVPLAIIVPAAQVTSRIHCRHRAAVTLPTGAQGAQAGTRLLRRSPPPARTMIPGPSSSQPAGRGQQRAVDALWGSKTPADRDRTEEGFSAWQK